MDLETAPCCGAATNKTVPASADDVRTVVREQYGTFAETRESPSARAHAQKIGYTSEDLEQAPEGANLGLGCGNPTALAALQPGEVVVDLGSGAGFDALLAARKVAPNGRVIGVDMTLQMLRKARENAVKAGLADIVEFREGIIEELPVVSGSADVVISNCVINLSPDKPKVFREMFRVLHSGGRIAVSDILLTAALPPEVASVVGVYTGCVGGAMVDTDYLGAIQAAGFRDIHWTRVSAAPLFEANSDDPVVGEIIAKLGADRAAELAQTIWSYKIEARRP
ncbi:arsenite methyltransferase [Mycobacterium nebraskense]|uniref:arsenite methyltransferase n=1 Tax=Mycobacterium nebraskense TaxID=244292 RepID=UPI000B2BF239|nr:arsenite methyltransferase [Mycobacterium nebraskense]